MKSNGIVYVGAAACLGNWSPSLKKFPSRLHTHTHTWWFSSSSRLATLSALSSNGKRIHKKQTANFYGIGRRRQLEHSSANYFSFPIRSLQQQQQQQQQHPPAQSSRTQGSTISYSIIYRQKTYPTVCVCVTISFLLPLCIVEG